MSAGAKAFIATGVFFATGKPDIFMADTITLSPSQVNRTVGVNASLNPKGMAVGSREKDRIMARLYGLLPLRPSQNSPQNTSQDLATDLPADGPGCLFGHGLHHPFTPSGSPQQLS